MKSDGEKKKMHIKYTPIPNRTLKSVKEIAPLQEETVVAIAGLGKSTQSLVYSQFLGHQATCMKAKVMGKTDNTVVTLKMITIATRSYCCLEATRMFLRPSKVFSHN